MSTEKSHSPAGGGTGGPEPQLFTLLDAYWEELRRGAGDTEQWVARHPEGF